MNVDGFEVHVGDEGGGRGGYDAEEMEDDPHSHQHRRELKKKNVATENCRGLGIARGMFAFARGGARWW